MTESFARSFEAAVLRSNATRDEAFEEAAQVCDRMIAEMEKHTDAGGTITGPDFFAMEIDALQEAAQIIRGKKSQPQGEKS